LPSCCRSPTTCAPFWPWATIQASARRLAATKTYWAAVGSGPNKASADEIRIKLSELCYKTISSDFVEDKKHIDLSSEPLIIVCAAGSKGTVIGDIIKDTAIFKAHKAAPVVIADEGEDAFRPYAEDVFHVPQVSPQFAPILNTLVGHIWGYHAALAITTARGSSTTVRESPSSTLDNLAEQGLDVYEVVLEKTFREKLPAFTRRFDKDAGPAIPRGHHPCIGSDPAVQIPALAGCR
jgi:glucosamine--fructose-6-phosphate aminotransferase (isomerizing)